MEFSKVGFKSNDVEIIQYPSGYAIIHVIVHRLLFIRLFADRYICCHSGECTFRLFIKIDRDFVDDISAKCAG